MEPTDSLGMFFNVFTNSFQPPPPRQKKKRIVSKRWSLYLKRDWLDLHFFPRFEYRVPGGRRRLDAALWWRGDRPVPNGTMDIALEWEWDDNKVHRDFPFGDFKKIVRDVDAACGVAIIQTRTDGRYRLNGKADDTLKRLREELSRMRRDGADGRPVGVVEFRRVCDDERVEFVCTCHDLGGGAKNAASNSTCIRPGIGSIRA
ncbi:MAG TPA: hypothetical protein VGX78_17450 [Pirellulales bacterium]|jgi:hypothetical protein|nr:hypothetical protein [Pirellulales bacterium]